MGEEFWVVTEFAHVGDVVGEVVNQLVAEGHIAARVVAEVKDEVGDAGLVDFGEGVGEVIIEAGVVGIVNAAQDGRGFVAAKLAGEPEAECGTDPRFGHAEAIQDGGFIEAGVELEVSEVLGGKEAVIEGMARGRSDRIAGAFAIPFGGRLEERFDGEGWMILEGDGEFVGFGGGDAGERVEVRAAVGVGCVQQEIAFGPNVFGAEIGSKFFFDFGDGVRIDGNYSLADGGAGVIGGDVRNIEVVDLVMDGEWIVTGDLNGFWIEEDAGVLVVVGGQISTD